MLCVAGRQEFNAQLQQLRYGVDKLMTEHDDRNKLLDEDLAELDEWCSVLPTLLFALDPTLSPHAARHHDAQEHRSGATIPLTCAPPSQVLQNGK